MSASGQQQSSSQQQQQQQQPPQQQQQQPPQQQQQQPPQQQQQQPPQQQQQQQPVAAGPNPADVQQNQADIGQAIAAPAGTLSSYETVPRDDGIGNATQIYGYDKTET